MGAQSPFEQLKEARISQSALIALGAGLLVGLLLGLSIGWVWWPVEWQGDAATVTPATPAVVPAAPAAGAPGLSAAAKASYLSAVADGYVPYSNAEAAVLASQRVAELGGDMRVNFEEALAYLATQPNANVRISNLAALASAVGVPLDAANTAAVAAAAAVPTAAATMAPTSVAQAEGAATRTTTTGRLNFPSWLAVLLLAGVLVGGGLFLLRHVAQRKTAAPAALEDTTAFADEDFVAPPISSTFDRRALTPEAYDGRPVTGGSVRTAPGVQSSPIGDGEAGFEEEEEDAEEPVRYTARPVAYGAMQPAPAEAATTLDEDDDYEEDDVDLPGQSSAPMRSAPPAPSARWPTAVPAPRPPVAGRSERYTTLDSHAATYHVGKLDFDFTKNVENPRGNGYIGEYGIGISERHGTIDNDLEQVVALEVYLFDKSDETQMSTVTRVLLSEYAHDNLYKFFDREKQSADPITAQANTNFQLEGKQLLLDCTVTDVRYSREGVFQTVTVEMVLKQKG